MGFDDKELICERCREIFVFSAEEQQFYETMGFRNTPKRCKQCRSLKKSATETHITCAECGAKAIVPFKPSRDIPVLCQHCFTKRKRA